MLLLVFSVDGVSDVGVCGVRFGSVRANPLSPGCWLLRQVETPTFSWVINCPDMERGLHYVTIFMLSAVSDPDREPTVMEPDKCEGEPIHLHTQDSRRKY